MRIAVGSDHAGFHLKTALRDFGQLTNREARFLNGIQRDPNQLQYACFNFTRQF